MANNSILISGTPPEYHDGMPEFYEAAVSSANEQVTGRVGMIGTAITQAKIWATGNVPSFIFDYQRQEGLNSGKRDREYQLDGEKADILFPTEGPIVVKAVLNDGESVTILDMLDAETLTGKLVSHVAGGYACAIALETASPSGSDKTDFVCLFFGILMDPVRDSSLESSRVITETLTPAANVATLTNTPILIEYVEAAAETGLGNLLYKTEASLTVSTHVVTLAEIPEAFLYIEGNYKSTTVHAFSPMLTTVPATDLDAVAVDKANKTLTFHATDAVQTGTVNVGYLYRGGDTTAKKIIVSGTVRQGEVKADYANKTLTFNSVDAVTSCKVRYWY